MKIIIIIIFLLFIQIRAYADIKEYIDSYAVYFQNESYKYISEGLKSAAPLSEIEKYKILDTELEKELETKFIYADLAECIQLALDGNYDIKITDAEVLTALWKYKNSIVQILPDAMYNYNISWLHGEYLIGGIVASMENEVPIQSNFRFTWHTINQGRYFFTMAEMRNLWKASKFKKEFTIDEIILNTVEAYYSLLGCKMELEVQKINLYDRLEQLKFTSARFEAGIGTFYDVKRAQAETAKAQQEYTAVLNKFRMEQAVLADIAGIDVFASIYPYETAVDTRELVDSSISMNKLYAQALELRDDIKQKEAEINVYKAQRSSNYADIIPAADISYENGHVGTAKAGLHPSNTLTLDVNMQLGRNLLAGTITQIKAGTALVKQKQLELENMKRRIKEDILDSYYNSLNAKKKIEASKIEVSAADVSLDLSLENMKTGTASFIDVIASQNLKVQANVNLIKNMIEYNKAQTKLLFDTGAANPANVLKDYKTRY